MKTRYGKCAAALLALLAAWQVAHAADPKAPDRREIWVPSADLKTVLDRNPRAVMLTREQYETLLRDAKKNKPSPNEPPIRATITSAHYNGELSGDVVDVKAEWTVSVLTDQWAEVPLRLESLALGEIKVDGEAAVKEKDGNAGLIIRGKGEHKITAEFMLPVERDSGVNSLQLSLPRAAAGVFTIKLPKDTEAGGSGPVEVKKENGAVVVSLAVPPDDDADLTWHSTGNTQQGVTMLFQESSYIYSIDETRVHADLGIVLNAALGSLPQQVKIKIPAGATPLQVLGSEVAKWNAADGTVTVDFTAGDRQTTNVRLLVETPLKGDDAKRTLELPVAGVEGVRRAAGKFAVIGSKGVKVRGIEAGTGVVQGEGLFDNVVEQNARFVAAYGFAVQPGSIKALVEKTKAQFGVDLDTLVELKREEIPIERTLALNGEEGEIFETSFTMPDGEELLSIRTNDNLEPDWKAEGRIVKIRWSEGMGAGQQKVFKIQSRMEPAKWPETESISLGDLKIPDATKVNGYLAVKPDAMFRVETASASGLEQRDGRTTPVQGDFAWFRREAFQLQLKIARREPEVQCTLLGYALPVDGALDVNGRLDFNILYSGVRKLRVKVPAESAEQFYFDGAQIAERNRDGDTWTIVLQKETSGNYSLKFRAMIPFDESHETFHVDVPSVEALDAKQQAGTWAIEANTATEVSFKPTGMNELDPLHAPALGDYQPRHHVIGVFGYLGAQHSLRLEGVKHEAAPVMTTVADRFEMESVISTSGAERHQAVFYVRTTGDQFLDVTLPEGSSVWSLTVNDELMKPVAERPNVVRVQLAATLDRTRPAKIQLLYETRRKEWSGAGGRKLIAPKLDARIPVLNSKWNVWLPDGYSYTAFDSNLNPAEEPQATPLLLIPWKWVQDAREMRANIQTMTSGGPGEPVQQPRMTLGMALAQGGPMAENGIQAAPNAPIILSGSMAIARPTPMPQRRYMGHEVAASAQSANPAASFTQNKLNRIIIPKIEFRDATVREAVDFLKQKTRELDFEGNGSERGVNINLALNLNELPNMPPAGRPNVPGLPPEQPNASPEAPSVSPGDARITLSLTNVPLDEALRYITNLAGLKLKVDERGVTIVPLSELTDTLITKEYKVPPSFLGTVPNRKTAREIYEDAGIQFPPGASATYDASRGVVIVRNTEANLDLADQMVDALAAPSDANQGFFGVNTLGFLGVDAKKVSGLLPMKLELEGSGREYSFEGFYAPEKVAFHYTNWWSQARRGWIWWVIGGMAFFAVLWVKPWRRFLWGVLALTFFPLCIAQSLTGTCNALLAGWLTAFVIHQIAMRFVFRVRFMEAKTA